MRRKFYLIIFAIIILFLPNTSSAAIIGNLENLSNVAYRLGQPARILSFLKER